MAGDPCDRPLGWFDSCGAATYRAAWERSPALVAVVVGPDHLVMFQNAASRDLFGPRHMSVPLGVAFPEMRPAMLDVIDAVRRSGDTVTVDPQTVGATDVRGDEVALAVVVSPVGPSGQVADAVVVHAVNVTGSVHADRAARRARLLAEVSAAVAAAADVGSALQAFLDAVVADFADFAAIFVSREPDSNSAAVPDVVAVGPALGSLGPPPAAPAPSAPSPWREVLLAGEPVIIPVNSPTIDRLAHHPASAAWLRASKGHTLAVLPLVVAGDISGAVVLLAAGPRSAYQPADLPFLADLAGRVAAALAHRRAQWRQQQIATRLQQALLPTDPPVMPGLSVAARYLSGAPDVEVGGDWWTVQPIDHRRVAIAIGDVSGRGVAAAAVMGQARAAMQAATHAGLPPTEVLRVLDAQLAELTIPDLMSDAAPPRFATSCYGVIDLASGRLQISNAGHLPPVVRGTGGDTRILELPSGTPLGLGVGGFVAVELELAAGDTVALFTDGLVESRNTDLDTGIAALAAALERFGGNDDLDAAVKDILEAMQPACETREDDTALLLVRYHPR